MLIREIRYLNFLKILTSNVEEGICVKSQLVQNLEGVWRLRQSHKFIENGTI